ncbi:lactonase family protein [Phocaeicola coprocola]|uniref:lactonase family protein n=1 Tax=Phocaeicola coprocola TaxID=310298 RepID=UPI003F821182
MKLIGICMAAAMALIGSGCAGNANRAKAVTGQADSLYLLVGSYAPSQDEGIRVYVFNQETGKGTYRSGISGISNPSFLTPSADGSRVYAVGEDEGISSTANALAFDRAKGTLSLINSQPTNGGAPCNITLSPKEDYVLTANYAGGSVTVFPLGNRGELLAGDTLTFTGSGPDKERQAQPHLHSVLFTPDNRLLLANDLGTDRIHVFPVNDKKGEGLLNRAAAYDVQLAPGSGPRHTCFAPDGKHAYLITELSGDVIAISYDEMKLDTIQTIKADTLDAHGSADIHISPDGDFVYASNRLKGDGIAIFSVSSEDGTLEKVGYQPTGIHPRNFVITPNGKFLLVACRDTNEIQVFARDADTGLLKDTGEKIEMSKPVCLKFVPMN